jgi:hypothetical protein
VQGREGAPDRRDQLHQPGKGDDRRQQDMGGEDEIPDRIAGDMAVDQRLVVPAGVVAGHGPRAVEGEDESDEGCLADGGDEEPDYAGPSQGFCGTASGRRCRNAGHDVSRQAPVCEASAGMRATGTGRLADLEIGQKFPAGTVTEGWRRAGQGRAGGS